MLYTDKISILDIVEDTTVDGPGFRTSIYGAGCNHQCSGCHNPESWNIEQGTWKSIDDIVELVLKNQFSNVTFTGGDPLYQVEKFLELAKQIKRHSNKTIWCYTGFRFEKVLKNKQLSEILPWIDVMVDGRFIESRKDLSLPFRGSSNQRIINVPKSLEERKVVLWERLI